MTEKKKILVIEDDQSFRQMLLQKLGSDYTIDEAGNAEEAIKALRLKPEVVILDLSLPEQKGSLSKAKVGFRLLERIKQEYPQIYVIILTGYGDTETIVKTVKAGADDFIDKGSDEEELIFRVNKAIEKIDLERENILLKKELQKGYNFSNIIGKSKPLKDVFNLIKRVAKTDSTVLILGESGTGKELVAGAIHYSSQRKDNPFVKINCAAIPEDLLEAELFGIEKNVATGVDGRMGRFEQAQCGTIFLDEIGDMSPSLQAKLLRVLQEREIEKIGGRKAIKVDVRIISATNKDLKKQIKENKFRDDLYFRLNVFPISLPPLRERREDIPLLIKHFIERYAKETKKPVVKISEGAEELLIQYDYPGNVRELENLIERAIILTDGDTILLEALPELKKREEPAL
ncbi:MAG: sigma-54 dependent transcriptional regulator [bacterium]